MDAMVPLCDQCPRCAWICDNLPHQSSIDDGHAYRHHPSLPSEKHRDVEEEWLRIVQSRALYNGGPIQARDGEWWRFPLRNPIIPDAILTTPARWSTWQIEQPTFLVDIYNQPWHGNYTRVTSDQPRLCFHVTTLTNLVEPNPEVPGSQGILNEEERTTVVYRGAVRAGPNGHNGAHGVFLFTYFPGHYWTPPGKCVLELVVYESNRVVGGSDCRQCATEAIGDISSKMYLQAVLVPSERVPLPVRLAWAPVPHGGVVRHLPELMA